jgi:uncharacterized protein (TIGR02611 family)
MLAKSRLYTRSNSATARPSGRLRLASRMLGYGHMSLHTIEQVRRVFRVVAGFTLLAVGVVMLVTPGPGWLVILFGLSLLAAEFIWARRLMDRMKREGERVRDVVWSYIPSRGASAQHPVADDVADKNPGPEPV